MKLLCLQLAIIGLNFAATAAEEEKLPDWMNIKIQIRQSAAKPRPVSIGDHLVLAKTALKQKTKVTVKLEFPAEVLAVEVKLSSLAQASAEMSLKDYLDLVLNESGQRAHAWDKSGDGVRLIPLYTRTFHFMYEARRRLEQNGRQLITERVQEMVKQHGIVLSRNCSYRWASEGHCLIALGRPEDIDALDGLLKPIDGRAK